MAGLQDAFWRLGGVPEVVRSDNLSAATHELPSGGRELNRRFAQVLDHYGVRSTRIEDRELRPMNSEINGLSSRDLNRPLQRSMAGSSRHERQFERRMPR